MIRSRVRTGRHWVIAPPHPERARLADSAGISPLLAQVMLNRGVSSTADVRRFLAPEMRELLPPDRLPNAVAAGQRLARAVRDKEHIVIYGDYDVDGVTATTILWHMLQLAGANVSFYIPSRLDEGYGVNAQALESIAADGPAVVITVDCGVTAVEEAAIAKQLGLELIITDHHEPRETLPEAVCIVHPTACGQSENPDLCGAGVALKVAWALAQELSGGGRVRPEFREFLLDAMAFAALGLVADVVPLTNENRVIASFGLKHLPNVKNEGVKALIEVSGLDGKASYDHYDVGFMLAPRLNAIGRLGHARLAVELFTRADATRAREIATTLDAQNRKRQEVERGIVKEAIEMVTERGFDRDGCHGIVLASENWHAGVVGIVASRLVERFGRPTVLIALENGEGQGSGRSVPNFPLHEVLAKCSAHLLSLGGHAMAAGVRLRTEQVESFTDAFIAEAGRRLTPKDLLPKLHLDDEISLDELSLETADALTRLAPHGPGNRTPRLATGVVEIADTPRVVGRNGAHLQLRLREKSVYRKAIAFGLGTQADEIGEQRCLRVAFEPIINEWNGRRSVELRILDWKPADA